MEHEIYIQVMQEKEVISECALKLHATCDRKQMEDLFGHKLLFMVTSIQISFHQINTLDQVIHMA